MTGRTTQRSAVHRRRYVLTAWTTPILRSAGDLHQFYRSWATWSLGIPAFGYIHPTWYLHLRGKAQRPDQTAHLTLYTAASGNGVLANTRNSRRLTSLCLHHHTCACARKPLSRSMTAILSCLELCPSRT